MTAEPIPGLAELLKIPLVNQDPASLKQLKERRTFLADKFYNAATPQEEKLKMFDELFLLHQYFGYKLPQKPYAKGAAKTPEQLFNYKRAVSEFAWAYAKDKANTEIPFTPQTLPEGKVQPIPAQIIENRRILASVFYQGIMGTG